VESFITRRGDDRGEYGMMRGLVLLFCARLFRVPRPARQLALLFSVAVLAATPQPARAQVPSPAQAQSALDRAVAQDPSLPGQIRARIQQSGLTPEEIRARLRARGYPENLLDPYALAPTPGQSAPAPGAYELSAVTALGLPLATGLAEGFVPTPGAGAPPSSVFGINMFRRSTTQFLPLLAGPVPPDYRLGPGDVLVLILTGDVELAHTLQVTREGFVLIPQVGQLFVSSLTLDQLRDHLYTRLGRVYSGVRRGPGATTRFDVSVANVRANQVFVVGEAVQPGAYQISSLGTVLTALYAAGGLDERGSTRAIQVRRMGQTVASLDLYDYLLRGDTRSDIRLETGDIVFIPTHGPRVWVTGAVRRPAIYESKPGEGLRDVLTAAGGFRPEASLRRLTVHRILPARDRSQDALARVAIEVPLAPGHPDQLPALSLEDGDSVVVDALPESPDAFYVSIAGMILKPGSYPWHPGMTLRELVRLAGGTRVGAELKEAEIARIPADRTQGQMAIAVRVLLDSSYILDRDSAGRHIGPAGAPYAATGAPEILLEPFDNALILRQPDYEFQRIVTVTGQVRYPGFYALRTKDERIRDLLWRAGGLTPQAYPEGIQFYRPLGGAGRLNIRLTEALADSVSHENVILQPGDSIHVPEYTPSVRISGAVNAPGSVLWKPGTGLDYYIGAAGGYAQRADEGRTSIRYANGEVRTRKKSMIFFSSSPTPGPGAEVFVPAKDPAERTDWAQIFGIVASLASVIASTAAVIITVSQ
jgi:protein involved in polysaccharide export with SLBB domain